MEEGAFRRNEVRKTAGCSGGRRIAARQDARVVTLARKVEHPAVLRNEVVEVEVAPDAQNRIFTRYERADGSCRERVRGTIRRVARDEDQVRDLEVARKLFVRRVGHRKVEYELVAVVGDRRVFKVEMNRPRTRCASERIEADVGVDVFNEEMQLRVLAHGCRDPGFRVRGKALRVVRHREGRTRAARTDPHVREFGVGVGVHAYIGVREFQTQSLRTRFALDVAETTRSVRKAKFGSRSGAFREGEPPQNVALGRFGPVVPGRERRKARHNPVALDRKDRTRVHRNAVCKTRRHVPEGKLRILKRKKRPRFRVGGDVHTRIRNEPFDHAFRPRQRLAGGDFKRRIASED